MREKTPDIPDIRDYRHFTLEKILHLIKQTLTWEKVDGIFERSAVEYLEKPRLLQWY